MRKIGVFFNPIFLYVIDKKGEKKIRSTFSRSFILLQSLYVLLILLCSHILLYSQSLHVLLSLLCSHILLYSQSLYVLLNLLCSHILLYSQSLYVLLNLLCSHIPIPPQSLYVLFSFTQPSTVFVSLSRTLKYRYYSR
jgi:hypothetical protein